MTCPICCADFTRIAREAIACVSCQKETCVKCVKTFLLEVEEPHCMHCRADWNQEFVDETLSRKFRTGELARHRRDYLLNREKARLPDTVEEAERVKKGRELRQRYMELTKRIQEHGGNEELEKEHIDLWHEMNRTYFTIPKTDEAAPRQQFIRACPAEDCRGFLSTQWKCKLCAVNVCSKCHEIKTGSEHTCDPGNIETAKLLAKDSKPCPKCGTMIFKTDGCDQMWCISCKTAFSWQTLRIETGRIHNPEYYRWMRESGQAIPRERDDECDDNNELPWLHDIHHALQARHNIWDVQIPNVIRCLTHVRFDTLPWLHNTLGYDEDPDKDLRIKYLLKDIDEDQWKKSLLHRERNRNKKRAKIQIYDMLVSAGNDLLHRSMQCTSKSELDEVMKAMEQFRKFFNRSCDRINLRFNHNLVLPLNERWDPTE